MKEQKTHLKIYSFSHPLMNTELLSILGDKYGSSLPFSLEVVRDPKIAQVIMWDGVVTLKNQSFIESILSDMSQKVLLVLGESMTLMKENPMVKMVNLSELNYVEISGWNILPEEILGALESCRQKLSHV